MVNKRLLELAERQKNPSLPDDKKRPKRQKTSLESELEKDSEGKPKITLNELEKTAVNTPTQEECNTLMQVYECGGWVWNGGQLPTQKNYWDISKEKTCIDMGNRFTSSYEGSYPEECKIISTQEFYNKQKITQENIDEINQWFEKNG